MLKSRLFSIFIIALIAFSFAFAQEKYPTGKGSALVSGVASYTSQLFLGAKQNTLTVVPSLFFFPSGGLGLGGDVSLNYTNISDDGYSEDITMFGIGPKFAYFFGGPESKLFPYIGAGVSYLTMSYEEYSISGFRIKFGGGICPLIGANAALPIEAGYMMDKYTEEGESISLNNFYFAIGIGSFIF